MNRVLISVEGQTEETFVRDVLAYHLQSVGVYPTAVILTTSRTSQGKKYKGGIIPYIKVQREIQNLLRDTNAVAISTMYDLYKLSTDFPGYSSIPAGNGLAKALYLEDRFLKDIGQARFHPYLQVHEYEAICFVDPAITARVLLSRESIGKLTSIKEQFSTPEDINDGEDTAPSKRILGLFPSYQKPSDGAQIASEIGLDRIRAECPHFNEWLTWLEGLGG